MGDSVHSTKDCLMTPIQQNTADKLYDRSRISTRTMIERTYGTGFLCYLRKVPLSPLSQQLIVATAVLHIICVIQWEKQIKLDQVEVETLVDY